MMLSSKLDLSIPQAQGLSENPQAKLAQSKVAKKYGLDQSSLVGGRRKTKKQDAT
jgi:hypothetical protein